ncbi:CcdB family protein [Devosia nitrariae]|uniref:CcdB family protein n=1 Tax=Devosia nitrariae TaxID=2071872 RepID=UPI0035EE1326
MARFDVFSGPDGALLVDVQADLVARMATRVVVPLLPVDRAPPTNRSTKSCFRAR